MKRGNSIRAGLAYGMVIGMSAAFLWHFSNIARDGRQVIQEPNTILLVAEIVLIGSCLIFAVWSFVKLLRSA